MNTLKKLNSELITNDDFKSLIRPLSKTEFEQLEESILKNGCQSPIIIWGSKNIILDGHNRYEICTEHNIDYKTISLEFLNEDEAKSWIIKNQFSRRNLTYYERASLAIKLESLIKEKAKENQLSALKQSTVYQNSDKREKKEKIHTNKFLAKICGVSHDTIARVRKIEKVADDETKTKIIKNKLSINAVFNEIQKQEKKNSKENTEKEDDTNKNQVVVSTTSNASSDEPEPSILSVNMNVKDSYAYIYSTEDRLADAFVRMKKLTSKYIHCIVWDRGQNKSPHFFIVTTFDKPRIDKEQVFPVFRKKSYNKSKMPKYYNDLIEEMLSAEESIEQNRN